MKLKILISIASIVFINGCGGSSNESNSLTSNYKENLDKKIEMEKNTPYQINKGDEIKNLSNPIIELSSDLESGKTIAILKSGEAYIIKK